jgi:hypothetical protein
LNLNKAPGIDITVARLLTENASYFSEPILPVFIDSIERDMVLEEWRCANVMAILK